MSANRGPLAVQGAESSGPEEHASGSSEIDGSRVRLWVGRAFATAAFVEAMTWTGLLIGMYVKYVPATTEAGVQLFGPLHGYAFIAYAVITVIAAIALRWRWPTILLAAVAAVVPLATVPLEIWMRRTGRLAPRPAPRRTR